MKAKIYGIPETQNIQIVSGNGSKGILFVIKSVDLSKNITTFEGLVKAIKLDIEEDISLISSDQFPISINSVLHAKTYTTIILIGVIPSEINFAINANPYYYYKMEGFSILIVDSLEKMNQDKSKKMSFWQNLQERFLS